MSTLVAIDPGPEESAFVVFVDGAPQSFGKKSNLELLLPLARLVETNPDAMLVLEMIASFGMPVGQPVFMTCVWIGRFIQIWTSHGGAHDLITRVKIKHHLCGSHRAKGANVRQALIDRFGPDKAKAIGTKKSPGPLYGVKDDVWSALAVGVTWLDTVAERQAA
jgi:hypothetical protein